MQARKSFFCLAIANMVLALIIGLYGREMLPLIIAIICYYLLKKPYLKLLDYGMCTSIASAITAGLFFLFFVSLLLLVLPPMLTEAYAFLSTLPKILADKQPFITNIINSISAKIPEKSINDLVDGARHYLTDKSTSGIIFLINLLPVTFEALLYFILVPIMMFFLFKDAAVFSLYFTELMPVTASITKKFWQKLDIKLGSYLQGKLLEILIMFIASLALYWAFKLKYALLMAGIMGVFVLIPVFGAIIATLPVILVALWQFGDSSNFIFLLIGHLALIAIDANIIVPILFSEKLDLHPLVILVGILLFGSILGFWGLFFAIPLLVLFGLLIEEFKNAFITTKQ